MKTIITYITGAVVALALTSCGTSWTIKVDENGNIIAQPEGPIVIKPVK